MAKNKKQKKNKNSNREINTRVDTNSAYASLCAIAPVIKDKNVFDVIHQKVEIPQKKVEYCAIRDPLVHIWGLKSC